MTPIRRNASTPTALPKYAGAVLAQTERAMAEGKMKPGGVYVIPIAHDDWCDLLKGVGPCNCDPEVQPPMRVPSPEEN